MTVDRRFSRLGASAATLAGEGFEPQRFISLRVLLTGSADVLATANGRAMARDALLLLMRTTKAVVVALPEGLETLKAELQEYGRRHAWDEVPAFIDPPSDLSDFAAILSVGGDPRPDLPWTVITSDGWTVRTTSAATPVNQACGVFNPVGALAAATLGVGEVFKRLLKLRGDKGALLDGCAFSLWSYDADETPGPALPDHLDIDLMVAGGGAIGNGVVHLLSQLPLRGRCRILDRQTYGEENWGTCLRLTRAGAADPKAAYLAGLFEPSLVVEAIQGDVEHLRRDPSWTTPPVILSGFDNVEARHAVQDLWPDLIIDGAIGQRLECKVGAHPWPGPVACLRCMYTLPAGERAEAVQERMTGLPAASLGDLNRVLSDADVAAADPVRRPFLAARVGRPLCSILEEAASLSVDDLDDDFRPSVPFAATFSACMMVAELVRYLMTGAVGVEPQYFLSLLWGPQNGDHYPEDRHADCRCVTRRATIDRYRKGAGAG